MPRGVPATGNGRGSAGPNARIGMAPPKRAGRDPAVTLLRSLANVPATVHRALLNVTELDERMQTTIKRVDLHAGTYLRSVRPGTVADPDALKQLRTEQRTALGLVEKKIQVSSEVYELVDKHVARLDAEIARYDIAAGIPQGRECEVGASSLGPPWEEPMYCTCGRPSFGDMVGCDNPDCAIEWFHFECVGISTSPTGEWLCHVCALLGEAKATAAAAARKLPGGVNAGGRGGPGSRGGPGGPGGRGGRGGRGGCAGRPVSGPGSRGGKIRLPVDGGGGSGGGGITLGRGRSRSRGRGHGRGRGRCCGGGLSKVILKKGLTSQEVCPACRGKHKAHTCGRGRSAEMLGVR